MTLYNKTAFTNALNRFLLSSDIRSEGSIAIVKKFYFDFLFYSLKTQCKQNFNSICILVYNI